MPDATCSKCTKRVKNRGMCSAHYEAWRVANKPPCSVLGCETNSTSHGLCPMHNFRMRTHGSLDDPRPSEWDTFWSHVDFGLCWED